MVSDELEHTPRTLAIDLAGLAAGRAGAASRAPWTAPTRALATAAAWSGAALGLARLLDAARRGQELPFVVAVGDAVRRGLPTAARASILARSPLTGELSDGQVGSELARRLASVADVLLLTGKTGRAECVLVLEADGAARLAHVPGLAAASTRERLARLRERFPSSAALVAGRAGERGVPFANLAAGEDPPSFVGRGGLGAAFAEHGLAGLVVCAPPVSASEDRCANSSALPAAWSGAAPGGQPRMDRVATADDRAREQRRSRELLGKLAGSPRLRARAEQGTLELVHAFAARGVLATRADAERFDVALARSDHPKKGCTGCPTPCGWVLDGPGGPRGLRFSAWQPLGALLGLERLEDALALLARCDDLGLDARETGSVLALLDDAIARGAIHAPRVRGDRGQCLRWIDAIVGLDAAAPDARAAPEPREAHHASAGSADAVDAAAFGGRLALGAERFAAWLGAAGLGAAGATARTNPPTLRGQSVRDDGSLASLLALSVSSRARDPMRASLFALQDASSRAVLERLLAPLELPPGAEDPRSPVAKGRIVWWHENVAAALDALGFCAFSAAGLLVDGILDLDGLARLVLPRAWLDAHAPEDHGRALLALGASVVALQRELGAELRGGARDVLPEWARAGLAAPGLLDEYERIRGVDARTGAVEHFEQDAGGLAILSGARPFEKRAPAAPELAPPAPDRAIPERAPAGMPRRRGVIDVRAGGALARRLPNGVLHATLVPLTVAELLRELALQHPAAAAFLVREERSVAAVFRGGQRLEPGELVNDADTVDLVVALSGG